MKRISVFLTIALLGLSLTPIASAANVQITATPAAAASASAEPQMVAQPVDSFELFWPLVAGKTRGDSLYFVKTWKENIRGWFIFGTAQKAEYQTFRATKRVLEAEALIKASKFDLAKDTEASANNFLSKSLATFESTKDIPEEVRVNVKNRLDNLIKLVDDLNMKTTGNKELNEQVVLTHSLIEKNLSALPSAK